MNKPSTWKLSPALQASAALHLGAVAAWGSGVPWPWAVGAVVANHAVLTAAGLWPRSTLLGANMLTLSAQAQQARQIALTIDDGPNPQVTPAVLDILDAFKVTASFFCVGKAVEEHPQLARDIVRRGHSIENHSYAHRHHFSLMGVVSLRSQITHAQDAIAQITGRAPQFFRAPAGLRSPLLDPVLQSLDLKLVTWTRRGLDTITSDPGVVLRRLENRLAPGDILLLHDGNCALTAQGQPVVLSVLPQLLGNMQRQGISVVSLSNAA
jgi:peptidoglycan-N-acetylglucosamine deacetylase